MKHYRVANMTLFYENKKLRDEKYIQLFLLFIFDAKVTHLIQDNSINNQRRIKGVGVRPKCISSTTIHYMGSSKIKYSGFQEVLQKHGFLTFIFLS